MTLKQITETKAILFTGEDMEIPEFQDPSCHLFFVLRHAEKGWGIDPGLTAEGRDRAGRLAAILKNAPVGRLFATELLRARQTLEPLGLARDLPVETYNGRSQGTYFDYLMRESGRLTCAVAGHQNTVPALLNFLTASNRYEHIAPDDYDNLFVALVKQPGESKVLHFRY